MVVAADVVVVADVVVAAAVVVAAGADDVSPGAEVDRSVSVGDAP